MQPLQPHQNLIMWPPDAKHIRKHMYTHSVRRSHAHPQGHAHTLTQRLNHIISAQIINDIIFGCSIYNVGQLDARGNKEGVTEQENEDKESVSLKESRGLMKRTDTLPRE